MTLGRALEQEHREIDQGIESFCAEPPAEGRAGALANALDELRRHIYFEEELLFPPLAEAGLVPPLFVMRREHGEMWPAIAALSAGLAAGTDLASLLGTCRELMGQLGVHNGKEEVIVYAAADGMIEEPARDKLLAELDSARPPEGWVCEAARR